MIKLIKFIFLCFFFFSLHAIEKEKNFISFNEAKESQDFIKFQIKSTKVGLFTSEVDGYVKNFSYSFNKEKAGKIKEKAKVVLVSDSFDTDSSSRDEKMKDLCLETTKFKKITITILDSLKENSPKGIVSAQIEIRGKVHPIKVFMHFVKKGDAEFIEGEANLSFSNLEIPDPSIAVASVSDEIKISFFLKL